MVKATRSTIHLALVSLVKADPSRVIGAVNGLLAISKTMEPANAEPGGQMATVKQAVLLGVLSHVLLRKLDLCEHRPNILLSGFLAARRVVFHCILFSF